MKEKQHLPSFFLRQLSQKLTIAIMASTVPLQEMEITQRIRLQLFKDNYVCEPRRFFFPHCLYWMGSEIMRRFLKKLVKRHEVP